MTIETEAERTPIDRPLTRADLNDVRAAMQEVSQKTLELYNAFSGVRGLLRAYVAICVMCAVVAVMAAALSVATVASAHSAAHP